MKNKKIAITGGNSGIGLAIFNLLNKNNDVKSFSRSNGYDLSSALDLKKLILEIKNYDYVFLNAGLKMEESKISIENIIMENNVNLSANQYIINELKSQLVSNKLKIIVTLSTSSYINGAYEAIYNSSKKALKEFIISKNTELKNENSNNEIFSFVPHYIGGTKMSGGKLNSKYLENMIIELINAISDGKNIYIPKYDEIYKNVFNEYIKNPINQGIKSIEYRKKRGL